MQPSSTPSEVAGLVTPGPTSLPIAKDFIIDDKGQTWEVLGFAKITAEELRKGLSQHDLPVGTEMDGPVIKGVFRLVSKKQ